MNNDLISRKQVIETAERVFAEYRMSYGGHRGGFAEAVSEAIENIPTAYDVDKVLEQLENCRDIMISPTNKDCFGEECKHSDCMACVFEKAIEIVKVGGLNENQRSKIKDT